MSQAWRSSRERPRGLCLDMDGAVSGGPEWPKVIFNQRFIKNGLEVWIIVDQGKSGLCF